MTGQIHRLVSELMNHRRCSSCFARVEGGLAGIDKVRICGPCFSLFNQTLEMPKTCFPSAEGEGRTIVLDHTEKAYIQGKTEYLDRFERNVAEYLKRERASLAQDAAAVRADLHDWYELRDAEEHVESLKRKKR